jgi:glycosyltransferase involved in cell wall biosynthesis
MKSVLKIRSNLNDSQSCASVQPWVLHIVPPNGGGVDRWVRDVLAHRSSDAVLHVTDEQWVFEFPQSTFTVLPPNLSADQARALGRPAWVHLHALTPATMSAAWRLTNALGASLAVTLHDVGFARDDTDEAARLETFRRARWVSVPSPYLHSVAIEWMRKMGGGAWPPIHVVANGWVPWGEGIVASPTGQGNYAIAMVGAVGLHKGLETAKAVSVLLPPEVRMVLIGYADGALTPGWLVRDRFWVHGVFEPPALPALLSAYGSRLVWFAAGQPESFCYALSDVWQSGWPVLVPDQGALGERVRQQGFGEVYDPSLAPERLARRLVEWVQAPRFRVHADQPTSREPTVAVMLERLNALYESDKKMTNQLPPDLDELQCFAQRHLDSRFFRKELLRLQGDLQSVYAEAEQLRAELQQLARLYEERGRWIEKLQAEIEERVRWANKLQSDIDTLNAAIAEMRSRKMPLMRFLAKFKQWLG